MLEVHFRLSGAGKARQFFAHGRVPCLHLYTSGGPERTAAVLPLSLAHFTEWSTARLAAAPPRALCFALPPHAQAQPPRERLTLYRVALG